MRKYEISLWDDVYDSEKKRYVEKKLIVIGSNEMTNLGKAINPNLKSNVDGTNVFSFSIYYNYIDPLTGEKIENPYINYLINERKIKVYWKDKWYDLIIKEITEDTSSHTYTYTCKDQYLTELSRTGFELEFDTELENNIGTAEDLIKQVLKGTDWSFKEGDTIYQETEEAVYETSTLARFMAKKNPTDEEIQVDGGLPILVFYSCAKDKDNLNSTCQFYYTGSDKFQQDQNDMLVINGTSYTVDVEWTVEDNIASAKISDTTIFTINFPDGLSRQYRAKRYVQSQKVEFNPVLERYLNIYEDKNTHKKILGYQTTEFNDALAIVNIITNGADFKNLSGWKLPTDIDEQLAFSLYPSFDSTTDITTYEAKSYLQIPSRTWVYNSGIQNNKTYIQKGFTQGEKYIFRLCGIDGITKQTLTKLNNFDLRICSRDIQYHPTDKNYFTILSSKINEEITQKKDDNGNIVKDDEGNPVEERIVWLEYEMECINSCPYNELSSSANPFGIFIKYENASECWIKQIQFFKLAYGQNGEGEQVRINPNEIVTQSVAQAVWRYFDPESEVNTKAIKEDDIEYLYTSFDSEWNQIQKVYNNYEKYTSITARQSNRFNILQDIAESFECWVKFVVEHDDTGAIQWYYDEVDQEEKPCKFIQLKNEFGEDTGLSFEYGIDLKSIKRTVQSSEIATKTIVLSNNNEFGKNGFCSIARSDQNYTKENFIYNFDYFINKGLLDRDELNNYLYNTEDGYYYRLNQINTKYMENADYLSNRELELTKQTASQKVYDQYLSSAKEELISIEDEILKLAGVKSMEAAIEYLQSHQNNTKVKTLINDRTTLKNTISMYTSLLESLNKNIEVLTNNINTRKEEQNRFLKELLVLNTAFYRRYSRFIQEGTWTSEDYFDDNKYYLDALQVAYQSSRPKISYDINVMRISDIQQFESKIFDLGDICYVQDTDYFGYLSDGITPYKEQVLISEITSYFDSPDKDTLKIQNYKTQFDDLFQRVTAATQSLEFAQGKYAKAANIVTTEGTIKSSVIQSTFNENKDLIYGAQNESVTMDNTGITVSTDDDAAKLVKITSGGIFVSNDGGATWKNAIRGDGITADVITSGSLNVENLSIYGADSPSFSWSSKGINAYLLDENGKTDFGSYVRFDKFGLYGIIDNEEFTPKNQQEVWDNAIFGLTWNKFFMRQGKSTGSQLEISTDNGIIISDDEKIRLQIGCLDQENNYGIKILDDKGDTAFISDQSGTKIAGWTFGMDDNKTYSYLKSKAEQGYGIELRSNGTIGNFDEGFKEVLEPGYKVTVLNEFEAQDIDKTIQNQSKIFSNWEIFVLNSYVGNRIFSQDFTGSTKPDLPTNIDINFKNVQLFVPQYGNYNCDFTSSVWHFECLENYEVTENKNDSGTVVNKTITWYCDVVAMRDGKEIFRIPYKNGDQINTPIAKIGNVNIVKKVKTANYKWSIDGEGSVYFKQGEIAGWKFDEEKIYRTDNNGNIITQLNSTGKAESAGIDYSIITDAINAAMASIGGVMLAKGAVDGINIKKLNNRVSALEGQLYSGVSKEVFNRHQHSFQGSSGYTGTPWPEA